jgi:hypothetical protein
MLDCESQIWTLCEPMKTYRHALAVVPFRSTFSVFNVSDDESISKRVCGAADAATENTSDQLGICAVGGWVNGSVCSADLEIFDFKSKHWRAASSMKHARRLLGAAALAGKLYVFGGNCDDGIWYTAAAERYSPELDEWNNIQDLPSPGPTSAAAVGNLIYVFLHGKRVMSYDPTSNTYSPLAPLPEPEWFSFDVTVKNNFIFAHGGAIKGVWSKAFYVYDTLSDAWLRLPDMITCRRRCAAALV